MLLRRLGSIMQVIKLSKLPVGNFNDKLCFYFCLSVDGTCCPALCRETCRGFQEGGRGGLGVCDVMQRRLRGDV